MRKRKVEQLSGELVVSELNWAQLGAEAEDCIRKKEKTHL